MFERRKKILYALIDLLLMMDWSEK